MRLNQDEIKQLYESVDDVWPQNDNWHLYSKRQIEHYLHKQFWDESIYVLNAGSGGNDYGLNVKMHHRDIAGNKINKFTDFSVGTIELLPQDAKTFDKIICVGSVINYCDAISVISEFSRVIKTGGNLILEFESSCGYEHRKNSFYGKAAEIVELRYFGELWSQWIYSPKYIETILHEFGFKIVHRYPFHILSAWSYSNCQDENCAAKYARFDPILRHFPCKKHANNLILNCTKL